MLGLWAQLCRTVKARKKTESQEMTSRFSSTAGRRRERESSEDPQRSLDLGGRRPQDHPFAVLQCWGWGCGPCSVAESVTGSRGSSPRHSCMRQRTGRRQGEQSKVSSELRMPGAVDVSSLAWLGPGRSVPSSATLWRGCRRERASHCILPLCPCLPLRTP